MEAAATAAALAAAALDNIEPRTLAVAAEVEVQQLELPLEAAAVAAAAVTLAAAATAAATAAMELEPLTKSGMAILPVVLALVFALLVTAVVLPPLPVGAFGDAVGELGVRVTAGAELVEVLALPLQVLTGEAAAVRVARELVVVGAMIDFLSFSACALRS